MESSGIKQDLYRRPLWLGLLVCSMGMPFAHAQNHKVEERLRGQLRSMAAELLQVREQLADEQAARTELATLEKEVVQLKTDLAAERARADRLSANHLQLRRDAQDLLQQALQQAGEYRIAHQDVLQAARAAEAERVRLAGELEASADAIRQCKTQNAELYVIAQELLAAYAQRDAASGSAALPPLAARNRAKFDEIAWHYGHRSHPGEFAAQAAGTADSAAAKQPDTSTQ